MPNSPTAVCARWMPSVNGHVEGVRGIEKEGIEEVMRRKSSINAGNAKELFAYEHDVDRIHDERRRRRRRAQQV